MESRFSKLLVTYLHTNRKLQLEIICVYYKNRYKILNLGESVNKQEWLQESNYNKLLVVEGSSAPTEIGGTAAGAGATVAATSISPVALPPAKPVEF